MFNLHWQSFLALLYPKRLKQLNFQSKSELLPGSAGGVRGIGGSVENSVDPRAWHGCKSREN